MLREVEERNTIDGGEDAFLKVFPIDRSSLRFEGKRVPKRRK